MRAIAFDASWDRLFEQAQYYEENTGEYINYDDIKGLRLEATQKLNKYRPVSIGQASRISGVSPADINVLLVYLQN